MNKKRFLSALLTLVMLVGMLPTGALAARIDDGAVPMEAPSDETDRLAVPVWEDADEPAQAELAETGVDLNDSKYSNLALGMVKDTGNTSVTFYPAGSGNWGNKLSYITDGDYDTVNAYSTSQIPAVFKDNFDENYYVQFDLGKDQLVAGFEFAVTQENANHGYKYAVYGKASYHADWTKLTDDTTISHAANQNIKQHPLSAETPLRYVRVVLHSGFGGAVPAFTEFKILGEEPLDLTTLTNIAQGMSPTLPNNNRVTDNSGNLKANLTDDSNDTEFEMYGAAVPPGAAGVDGACFMEFDFGENRKIGGFEFVVSTALATSYTYKYNIYGRANGVTQWTEYVKDVPVSHAAGQNAKQHPFASLTDLRYVRVVLHSGNQWGAVSEFRIFGEAKPDIPEPDDPVYGGLKDLAPLSTITVPSTGSGRTVESMRDGDSSTFWTNDGTWPCEVMFALPGNAKVKRIEINFENHSNRSMRVTLNSAFNSVTSDMSTILGPTQHTMSETLVFADDSDEGTLMSHLQIVLDNPLTNGAAGAFWPNIAEVKIWAIDEAVDLNKYADITSYAGESTTGSDYKEWDFKSNQQIAGFKVTLPDGVTGVLKGRLKRDKTYTTYIQTLKNGDNILDYITGMSAVRVELSDPSQLTGFQIWGTYTEPQPPDPNNLSFDKPTHTNFNDTGSYLAVDGNTGSGWQADMYPAYLDIDLEENYHLSEITVHTPTSGYTQYTVYTSMDGRDFELVADRSKNHDVGTTEGDTFTLNKEARIVRVYLEYYSASNRPTLNEVTVKGTATNTPVQTAPAVTVEAFENTSYANPITEQDTIDAVKGIITRQVGAAYVDWFTFALADGPNGYDYFTLSDESGKIKVTGNNGVSLATGVNHYLKYFCNVHISQVGNQVNMPAQIVPVGGTIHKETKYPVRYAYNYCTHSYTMSFWNEPEWQNELDWQALNGVNVVLDITGQEEVWREFLMSVGYTHQEAKDFLAGPGYYAWAYMANLTGFGGPIHDSFLTERVELARKNQRFMRVLGMEPVLQAFSGMVPVDLSAHDPSAAIITQGNWCSFRRPDMLKTDTATYDEYARKFYAAQKRVFGDVKYYATDPFHEGGNTGGMSPTTVASALLDSLLEFDSDAVWIIQSWQGNPSTELLTGLRTPTDRRSHALVLDLWAEHSPHNNGYGELLEGNSRKEFSNTPWVWCMLNNFGGRMGLHGHLDALQKNIPADANASKHMAGIGMSPEGAQENPVLYDFLFETIWVDNASENLPVIDLNEWLANYVRRRYGAESENAYQSMLIMKDTVYKSSLNMAGQGSPESVINGRPTLAGGKASTWGNGSIGYSAIKLENALKLLLTDYDTLSASDAYLYDVADVLKQQLSNYAITAHQTMATAYRSGDFDTFTEASDNFLALIDEVEKVLATRSEFTFGKWTGGAEYMALNADDFTKRLYLRNAKALVTTWGSIQQCNGGGLKDYSNRQWAGLTNDFYKQRWIKWIDAAKAKIGTTTDDPTLNGADWFAWEWEYARDQKSYSSTPSGEDLKALAEEVLANYSVLDPLGGKDLDPTRMTVKTGSEHTSTEPDAAVNAVDRDTSSIWHTDWNNGTVTGNKGYWWLAFDLGETYAVDGLRYLPRQSNNVGRITGYEIYVSTDDAAWNALADDTAWTASDAWTEVADSVDSGSWANDLAWKEATFTSTRAKYVVFKVTGSTANGYCSAAEVRITGASLFPVTAETVANGSIAIQQLVDDSPVVLEGSKAIAGDTLRVTGTSEGNYALTDVTVARTGGAQEGDEKITVTPTEAENGLYAYTFTMPAYPVTVTGAFKTKAGTPTVTAEGNIFRVGKTLTAAIGENETVTYQWYRHEADANDVPIPGATNSTYTLLPADSGKTVTVKVTGTDNYAGWAESAPTVAIKDAAKPADSVTFTRGEGGITMWLNDASKNTDQPVAEVGNTTTVTATANGAPTEPLTVSWAIKAGSADDVITFTDANSLQLPITAAKVGSTILVCSVTAADTNAPVTGEIAITVKAKAEDVIVKKGGTDIGAAPIVIWTNEGDANYPHSVDLTAEVSPADADNTTLNWNRAQIEGLVTLTRTDDTHGHSATITAKADRAKTGSVTVIVSSAADATVKKQFTVQIKTHVTNKPSISGTAKVGETLTAQISNIQMVDSAKNALKYQWFRADDAGGANEAAVNDANTAPDAANTEYILTAADYGKYIFVKITSDDTYYDCQGVSSAASAQVAEKDGPAAPTGLTGVACATAANNDGKITGLESGKTYELRKEAETEDVWEAVTSKVADSTGALTGLTKGDYQVRIPADDANKVAEGAWSTTITVGGFQEALYSVAIDPDITGGTVTANHSAVAGGTQVTITVTPDASHGYELTPDSLTVTAADGGNVQVTDNKFTMPEKNVTITAAFRLKKVTISHTFGNMKCSLADQAANSHEVDWGTVTTITLTPNDGYKVPSTITVKKTGEADALGNDFYTYRYETDRASATITFTKGVTENITITGDAELKTYTIHHNLTHLTAIPDRTVNHGENYNGQLRVVSGYALPETITVKKGSDTLQSGENTYSYNKTDGSFTIQNVTSDMVVEATGEKLLTPLTGVTITIGHTDASTTEQNIPHVGDTLTANVTAQGTVGGAITATYEWFHDSTDGAPIASGQGPTYTLKASDLTHTILVRVTGTGDFTGVKTSDATQAVQEKRVAVTGVSVSPATATLVVGEVLTLTATVSPEDAANQKVTWSSHNATIASVDPATGLVTAVSPGTVTIVATSEDGNKTATCSLTVREPAPDEIVANATEVNVPYDGQYHHITVTVVTPATGAVVTYAETLNGVYTAINPSFAEIGEYTVYYKITADGYTTKTGSATVVISVNTKILTATIDAANAATTGVQIIDGKTPDQVSNGTRFVTTDEMKTLTDAIDDARAALETKDQTAVDAAVETLEQAVEDFRAAIKTGTKGNSSSGSSSSRPSTSTNTETREDGSKVITVTKPDGSKTVTVEQPDGIKSETVTTKDGDVTITVTDKNGEELVKAEIPATIPEPETKFEDLDTTPWAEEAIHKMAGLELVNGTGENKYSPIAPMTRGSLATVLHRLSQGKTDYESTFKDVAQGRYYTEGVAWAAKAGVVKGITDEIFAPEQTITREQLAVMMARYAKLVGLNTKADAKALDRFTDGDATGTWAVDGVAWCVQNGILKGKGNDTLDPTAEVTRAEVAVMLDRFIKLLK